MMVARGSEGANEFLLLGLSRENVNRLIDGKPIRITRASHGSGIPINLTIGIMFGETEADIVKVMQGAGMLAPDATVFPAPHQ